MTSLIMLTHQNLILHVEVADVVAEVHVATDEEGSHDRIFNAS